ncbi:hypothetical protein [Aurantiacibacter spongiae]|uniref:17 kDa surface antigen n=1 Tax=Aurantiacibacter spongiae TaxID=2488860 RepID=A0A3N5DGA5_9SPHN|nr:hypothetical protein [Aurantiacibacter spongiae]RPF70702.1 hypothetical protein EG799_03020 [Aurantiacibacter spongiae]
MKTFSKALGKGTMASLAAGAMALASASPAAAQGRYDRYDRDHDGISAGEVIAGAVILGGLAAILSSGNNDRYDRDYRYGTRGYGYDRGGYNQYGSRQAVEQCVRTAEAEAQRYLGTRAEVYEIRDVDRERNGYEVKGRIAVQEGYGRYDRRDRYGRYDRRGYGNYRRGYNNRGWDEGRFECDVRYGRITDLDFSGIRGL